MQFFYYSAPNHMQADIMACIPGVEALTRCQATGIIQMLRGSPFHSAQRNELTRAINFRVSGVVDRGGNARQTLQTIKNLHNYLTKDLHSLMRDGSFNTIVEALSQHLVKLGAVALNEPSFVSIIAAWEVISKLGDANRLMDLDVALNFKRLQELKACLRIKRSRIIFPHTGITLNYPVLPNDLRETNEAAFNMAFPDDDHQPIKFPYDILSDKLMNEVP